MSSRAKEQTGVEEMSSFLEEPRGFVGLEVRGGEKLMGEVGG